MLYYKQMNSFNIRYNGKSFILNIKLLNKYRNLPWPQWTASPPGGCTPSILWDALPTCYKNKITEISNLGDKNIEIKRKLLQPINDNQAFIENLYPHLFYKKNSKIDMSPSVFLKHKHQNFKWTCSNLRNHSV